MVQAATKSHIIVILIVSVSGAKMIIPTNPHSHRNRNIGQNNRSVISRIVQA